MPVPDKGTLAHGKHPVALSGRVYCWVDASQGAIIGKAMTGLKEGKGLVLVPVTLQ